MPYFPLYIVPIGCGTIEKSGLLVLDNEKTHGKTASTPGQGKFKSCLIFWYLIDSCASLESTSYSQTWKQSPSLWKQRKTAPFSWTRTYGSMCYREKSTFFLLFVFFFFFQYGHEYIFHQRAPLGVIVFNHILFTHFKACWSCSISPDAMYIRPPNCFLLITLDTRITPTTQIPRPRTPWPTTYNLRPMTHI